MLNKLENFHEFRRNGIGGSDVAAILGVSKWKTAQDVYFDKVCPIRNEEYKKENVSFKWQKILEEPIIANYEIENECSVERSPRVIDKKYCFLRGNLDGYRKDKNAVIEVKTALYDKEWGEEGTSNIPPYYITQVAHYAAITNCDYVDIVVLFTGTLTHRQYRYDRNEKLESTIREKCIDFWNKYVLTRTVPPINTTNVVNLYKKDSTLIANDDLVKVIETMQELKAQEKRIKERIAEEREVFELHASKYDMVVNQNGDKLATYKAHEVNKFNTELFKKENPELYKEYLIQTKQRTLRL